MAMWTSIECVGHPRDMGLAQGRAERAAIRDALARADLSVARSRLPSLRPLASGPVRGGGAGRDFLRHFAHLAERIEGLAEGANVPFDSVLELHLRIRAGGDAAGLLGRRASLRARTVGGDEAKRALLERSLPRPLAGEARWVLRDSRPSVGFRSVEVTLPWLATAVAGVNEGGLAVVSGPALWGEAGRGGAPPSALLVQECLQRFADVAGAVEWCRKRPVEGEQTLVLVDASGAVSTVVSHGRERRVQSGEGELYLEGGEPAPTSADDAPGEARADRVWLDPGTGRLQLDAADMAIEVALREGPDPQ
jgi:hypothetical protein